MGRQSGVLQVTGSVGNLSFYHNRLHGYLLRRKGGASAEKIAKDPQFERTRENASEFGAASSASRQIRHAIRACLHLKGDAVVTQRLTSLLSKQVVKLDVVHERGKRRVASGLLDPEGRKLLREFAFHEQRPFDRTVRRPVGYTPETGEFRLTNLHPGLDFQAPKGATHVRLQGMTGLFDFDADTYQGSVTPTVTLALNGDVQDVVLVPDTVPTGAGTQLGVLTVVFLQEMNGELYKLREGENVGFV